MSVVIHLAVVMVNIPPIKNDDDWGTVRGCSWRCLPILIHLHGDDVSKPEVLIRPYLKLPIRMSLERYAAST